jgi:hypothetical protein
LHSGFQCSPHRLLAPFSIASVLVDRFRGDLTASVSSENSRTVPNPVAFYRLSGNWVRPKSVLVNMNSSAVFGRSLA